MIGHARRKWYDSVYILESLRMADQHKHANNDGPKRSVLLIFIMLLAFAAVGVWFWMNQEQAAKPLETASTAPETLEPLPPPQILDRVQVSDDQAVADGTLRRFDDNRWLESDSFVGTDKAGKQAELRIYILSENYSWAFGDGQTLEGPAGTAEIDALLSGGDFQNRFCESQSVLAIGTSSFEGASDLNHRLASERARHLVAALAKRKQACSAEGPQLLGASLGEHAETSPCPGRARCPEATSSQRRLILVGVEKFADGDKDINYDEALWSGMRRFDSEQDNFFRDFRLSDYDQFEVLK